MARLPASIPDLVAQFGPHLNREPSGGRNTRGEPDRIADPLMLLRPAVRHPAQGEGREDRRLRTLGGVPLQQRKLCPKGVKRYMQDEARPRHRAPFKGRRELHGRHQSGGGHGPHRARRLRLRHDHRSGQREGAREQGQKCDQLPGARDLENPAHREYIAGVWGSRNPPSLIPDCRPCRCSKRFTTAGSRACCSSASTRRCRCPTATSFGKPSAASSSSPSSDEGTTTNVEGRVIHHRQVVQPPEGARQDWRIICDLAQRLGVGDKFAYESTHDIFEELRIASKGGVADYAGITWERIDREVGVFWPCPSLDHPGTPRLYEGWQFGHPDGKAHFQPADWRPAAEEPDADYPIVLTTGRVVSQYLSGTDASHRRARRPVPAAAVRDPSALGRVARDRGWRLRPRREPAPCHRRPRAGRENHSARHGVRPVPLAARPIRQQLHDPHNRSDFTDFRSSRSARFASRKRRTRSVTSPRSSQRPEASGERACVLHRLLALHRVPGLCADVRGMRHAPRAIAHPPRNNRAARQCTDGATGVYALRRPYLRAGLSRGRHQADRRGRRPELAQAALHRLLELRARVRRDAPPDAGPDAGPRETHPELRRGFQQPSEPQCRIGRDAAIAEHNLIQTV
jgi:hypothetical protein